MKITQLLKTVLVAGLGLASINLVQAYTYQSKTFNKFYTEIHARLNLQYLKSESLYPNYLTYKQSYFYFSNYFKINYVNLGWKSITNYAYNFSEKFSKLYQQRLVIFTSNPLLGETEIGRNTSILVDYLSDVSGFTTANSVSYPLVRSDNILNNLTWKYTSKPNSYYHYGYSFNLKEHKEYGNYSGQQFFIRWDFKPNLENTVSVGMLVGKQSTKDTNLDAKFVTYPYIVTLAYKYSDIINFKLSGYYEHENYQKLSNATHISNRNYGFITNLVVSPLQFLDLYTTYTNANYKNRHNYSSLSSYGFSLAPNSRVIKHTWTSGIKLNYHNYLQVFTEYSKSFSKTSSEPHYHIDQYYNIGLILVN